MIRTSPFTIQTGLALLVLVVPGVFLFEGCKRADSKKSNVAAKDTTNRNEEDDSDNRSESESVDPTLLERTGGMLRKATDSSMEAAGNAGTWIKDKVQDTYESGKEATVNAGNALRDMFQRAKEKGTTTANNVVEFVKEDFAKLGSWKYASRTVSNESPDEVVKMLNQMGADKWECFWVDKQPSQTTLYFKKTPRSYINSIPFKDMIKYLPELGGGN